MKPTTSSPLSIRVQFAFLRLLGWVNGLEAWLSMTALAWGVCVLIDPDWWDTTSIESWPVTPHDLAAVLCVTGLTGVLTLRWRWRFLRMATSVVAFMAWGLLTVYDVIVFPGNVLTQSAALHGMMMVAELGVYVRVLIGFDQRCNQLGGMVLRPPSDTNTGE